MKIITRAVFQMTAAGYALLEEHAFEYAGPLAVAKSSSNIFNKMAGGSVNKVLDPLDLFGGEETREALDAQASLPTDLANLNKTQAEVSRYDTAGPFGSSSWSVDPTTGRYTQTTNLNDSEQQQFDTRNQIAEQMLGKAQQWAPASSSTFNYDREVPAIAQQQYAKTQSLTSPEAGNQQAAWAAKMQNAGIAPGSAAYQEVQGQRAANANAASSSALNDATTQSAGLAQQQRQQRMSELAQLIGSQQLNSPASGGTGIDVSGSTQAAGQAGINNANQSAAQRNANMQSLAGLLQLAYPNGFGG